MFAKSIDTSKMKHPKMLYKHPGPHKMGKEYFDYIIVDKCDEKAFDAALADGWFESMPEAKAKKANPTSEPEKVELEKPITITPEKPSEEPEKVEPEKLPEKPEQSEDEKAKDAVEKSRARRESKK